MIHFQKRTQIANCTHEDKLTTVCRENEFRKRGKWGMSYRRPRHTFAGGGGGIESSESRNSAIADQYPCCAHVTSAPRRQPLHSQTTRYRPLTVRARAELYEPRELRHAGTGPGVLDAHVFRPVVALLGVHVALGAKTPCCTSFHSSCTCARGTTSSWTPLRRRLGLRVRSIAGVRGREYIVDAPYWECENPLYQGHRAAVGYQTCVW